jgi:hypothetical protein
MGWDAQVDGRRTYRGASTRNPVGKPPGVAVMPARVASETCCSRSPSYVRRLPRGW